MNRNSKLRAEASYPEIQKTIQRARSKAQPTFNSSANRTYKSIWHFAKDVEEKPDILVSEGADGVKRHLTGELVKSSSKTYHFIMYDPELANEFTENETFWDGTFEVRPKIKNVGQFFTIMGLKNNVVSQISN